MERGKLLGRWVLRGQVVCYFGCGPLSQLPFLTVFATGIFSGFSESLVSFMKVFNGAGTAWNNIRFLSPALRLVSVCVPLSAAVGLSWVLRALSKAVL